LRLYHHYVFPHLLDFVMSNRMFRKPRDRTLAPARGRILEIGFGTGMNLTHYPPTVKRIEAIDPDLDLDRYSLPRIAAAPIEVDFHHLDAEHLRFLFLEHGRSPDPGLARWQDRLNSVWMPLAGGCHLNRPTREMVAKSGLELGPVQNYYLKRAPRIIWYMTEGMALKR
jgi:hypothetical protein